MGSIRTLHLVGLALCAGAVAVSAQPETGHGGSGEGGCGYMKNYAQAAGEGIYTFKHGGFPGSSAPAGYSDWSVLPNRGASNEDVYNGKVEDFSIHNVCQA